MKSFIFLYLLVFLSDCAYNNNKDKEKLVSKYSELKLIKEEIISNSFDYLKTEDPELVRTGIYCLFYSGYKTEKRVFEEKFLDNKILGAYLFLIRNNELEAIKLIKNDSIIIEFLPEKFMKTKNKKYFNLILKKYNHSKNFDDKLKIIRFMRYLNICNIEKFFNNEMEFFGKLIFNDMKNIVNYSNITPNQKKDFIIESLNYFASLSKPIYISNFYKMFVNSTNITNDFELYQGITTMFNSFSRNNALTLGDWLVKEKIWNLFEATYNQWIIKSFLYAINTNIEFKNQFLSELKDFKELSEDVKLFLLEIAGDEKTISNKLYSYDFLDTLKRISFFKYINVVTIVEDYILKEEFKKFCKNELEVKKIENYIYDEGIIGYIFFSVLRNKELLSKHITFFDKIRKRQNSIKKRAKLDLLTSQLIWLVENGYFEYE